MSANKHTPGPWHMDPEEVTGGFRIVPKIGDRGLAVAIQRDAAPTIPGSGIDRATAEANARLIAAAPELLEFIKHAADQLESGIQEYTESPEEPPQPASKWDYDAGQLVGELRRLIAKATGSAA